MDTQKVPGSTDVRKQNSNMGETMDFITGTIAILPDSIAIIASFVMA
jgi:hypothetical protein